MIFKDELDIFLVLLVWRE